MKTLPWNAADSPSPGSVWIVALLCRKVKSVASIPRSFFAPQYSPTNAKGKREVHTVYAKTKEECEVLLEKMIAEVREKIKEEKVTLLPSPH